MKLLKKRMPLLVLTAVLLCAAFTAVYVIRTAAGIDNTPPVINIAEDVVELSVYADESQLLQGVTAQDDTDGNVTDSLVVEQLSGIHADHTATVTYAAFDRAGNVTKATRTVRFTDYTSPRFGQTEPLLFRANSSPDVLACMTAEDAVDGNLSNRVKGTLISDSGNLNYTGIYEIEFRVTNSLGDTVHLTLPVEVYTASAYNATVTLTEYLVYLKVGEAFLPEAYLDTLTAGNYEYPLTEPDPELDYIVSIDRYRNPDNYEASVINVNIDSNVDTTQPGVYSVTYAVNLNERYDAYTRLNVIVEE